MLRRPTVAESLALAALAVLVVLPLGIGPYPVRLATVIFMWAALAGAWNLMAGYAGSTDLGPVVHYGVGAFATAAFMLKAQLPFLVSVVLGGVVAMAVAYALGTPTLRLRGAYFAIGTLALAESAKEVALAWDRFREDIRFFRFDRISKVHLLGSEFRLRPASLFLQAGEPDARTL